MYSRTSVTRTQVSGFELSGRSLNYALGTLRSDNGDVHENVAETQTSHHFKLFRDYPNSPCYLQEGDFGWS